MPKLNIIATSTNSLSYFLAKISKFGFSLVLAASGRPDWITQRAGFDPRVVVCPCQV